MTIEEKAKRYDEAIRRAKAMKKVAADQDGAICFANTIFPELQESEDEKIRKEIINYFQCQSEKEPTRKEIHNKWLAWLEKQGEKKVTYTTTVETGDGGINALVTRELPTDGCDDGKKSAWSEEDEENMEKILDAIGSYYYLTTDDDILCDWLKSIKQRIGGE